MSAYNAALFLMLLFFQATFIKDTRGQNVVCQILDLAFLIDGSGSICDDSPGYVYGVNTTCDNWNFIVQFVLQFVLSLDISPSTTRVAVATFSDNAQLLWNLTTYSDRSSLQNAINTLLKFPTGNTYTDKGLYLLTNQVFVRANDRANAIKTCIIITDGKPTDNSTVPAAIEAVHNAGIRTLVVGVTNNVDNVTLKMLSSSPQMENVTYFWAKDFKTIDQVRAQLYNQTCQNASVTVQPTSAPGTISPTECGVIDLCFIVDRSGSICDSDRNFTYQRDDTCRNWADIVTLIHNLVSNLNIGPSYVRVALVIFDETAQVAWGLAKYSDKTSLLNAIDSLRYIKGGTTDIADGLDLARIGVFNTPDDRPTAANVAVTITDGKPTVASSMSDAIRALNDTGCRMLAVGVTDSYVENTLKMLSSPPSQAGKTYFVATNYSTVNAMSNSLLAQTCPQSTTVPTPLVDPCPSVQDVVIVLDGSGSICDSDAAFNFKTDMTCKNWALILQALHNLIDKFFISPVATRVALILFSTDARLVWGLDVYTDKSTLLYAIDNLQYVKGGTTNMTGALKVLNFGVFTPQLTRPNVPKIAIIFTDGKPTDPSTVDAAVKAVQDSGIKCFVVGVTNQTDNQTLIELSSPPKTLGVTYFLATDYGTIDAQVTAQLIAQACPGTSTTPSTTTTPAPTSPSTSGTTRLICSSNSMLDLAFVVDGSGSICGDQPQPIACGNWNSTLAFIHSIAQSLPISPNQTRVGMIIFSSKESTRVLWNLSTYTTSDDLLNAINKVQYPGGTTYTATALDLLLTSMFVVPSDRPNVNKTAIIITDGKPSENTTVPAAVAAVHAANITTIAVGVTNSIDEDTLKLLSSPPRQLNQTYFMTPDFNSFSTILNALLRVTCSTT